jgi:nicotinate-nucleotide--dimethylbenzimidazole phosphoribosyltransferase
MFCRQHGFHLRIVDVGVDHDLSAVSGIIDRKIARGTRNFRYEAAMTEAQYAQAFDIGRQLVDDCAAEGCNVLCIGEMGIGNTSPSSVWMHLLGGVPLEECIGAGAGLDASGMRHKYEVLRESVDRFLESNHYSLIAQVIRYFGGFEMVTAIAAMLHAASRRMLVLVDGFIMTACALAAVRLQPQSQDCMIFTHCGDENGHRRMLEVLHARPLLNLGLRLGEGTGALCAYPIVDSAVRMMREMNNFDNAKITKYF